jgi:hypothetical protein
MNESLLVDDARFLEFMQEKLKSKSQKYESLKKYGIIIIGVFVLIMDVLDTTLDRRISAQRLNGWYAMLISSMVTTLLLLIMFAVAIAILITATRTMDKIDMARGEAQQK